MSTSKNPFRRTQQPPTAPEWYSGDIASAIRPADAPASDRRRSSVKRVRIQTPPPLSPDSVPEDDDPIIRKISAESHEGSPPPDPARIDPAVLVSDTTYPAHDPFAPRFEEDEDTSADEELRDNTRRNSATGSATTVEVAVPIIKNPFQRTLATMETPQARSFVLNTKFGSEESGGESQASGKLAIDVDAFKRLLLTGTAEPGNSGPPSISFGTASSSSMSTSATNSTDTISTSRTLDDRPPDSTTAGLSRGTVDESSPSPKSFSVSNITPKIKPPPPAHRHGKLVNQPRLPQIVSFSDFSPTDTPLQSPRGAPKALPPQPPRHRSSSQTSENLPPISSTSNYFPSEISTVEPHNHEGQPPFQHQSKAPPPPLARRTSQLKSQASAHVVPTLVNSTSSTPSLSESTPTPPSRSTKPPPPPPPTRRTAPKPEPFPQLASTSSSRSSSISLSSQQPLPNPHRSSMLPPPAPPPRRRGSSKSSVEVSSTTQRSSFDSTGAIAASRSGPSPRTSGEEKRASISSLERATRDLVERKGMSILDDMDALQAEIDALHAKSRVG